MGNAATRQAIDPLGVLRAAPSLAAAAFASTAVAPWSRAQPAPGCTSLESAASLSALTPTALAAAVPAIDSALVTPVASATFATASAAALPTGQGSDASALAAALSTATAAAPATPESSDAEAKAARHFERTRRAVLRFIDEQGGVAGLADMHDYSERKYFIGHRRFSDLMETLLEDALIDYDHGAGEARITDKGRELGNTKMPPRKRAKG